jgi:hypothetical protein
MISARKTGQARSSNRAPQDGPARRWEPKRLRLRLFSAAGRLVRGGRRLRLRIAATWPWNTQITAAITNLQSLAPADQPEPSQPPGKETRGPVEPRPPGATAGLLRAAGR